jgi:hypothetical protein
MNASFERKTALMLLRHVGRRPSPGAKTDRDVNVMAAKGRLYFINSHTTAACTALVLEPGAFWIRRRLLEQVFRSFADKEVLILEADHRRMTIGRFSCAVTFWQLNPNPPETFEDLSGTLRLQGESP